MLKKTTPRGTANWRRAIVIPTAFALVATTIAPVVTESIPEAHAVIDPSGTIKTKSEGVEGAVLITARQNTSGASHNVSLRFAWDSSKYAGHVTEPGAITMYLEEGVDPTKVSFRSGEWLDSRNSPVGLVDAQLSYNKANHALVLTFTKPSKAVGAMTLLLNDAYDNLIAIEDNKYSDMKVRAETVKVTSEAPVFSTDADRNAPQGQSIVVEMGDPVNPEAGIENLSDLENVEKVAFESKVETSAAGEQKVRIVVTYEDGSKDYVDTTVVVKDSRSDADRNYPVGQDMVISINTKPNAQLQVENYGELKNVKSVKYSPEPVTNVAGTKYVTIVVTYDDGTTDELRQKLIVKDDRTFAEQNNPEAQDQTVFYGQEIDPKNNVANYSELENVERVWFESTPSNTVAKTSSVKVLIKYTDGSVDEIEANVTVKDNRKDAEKYDPQGVSYEVPKNYPFNEAAKDVVISSKLLPAGTTFVWASKPSTAKVGNTTGTVTVTYPDGSKDSVTVKVSVTDIPDNQDNTPVFQDITVGLKETPIAGDAVKNKGDLPEGTVITWKEPIDTSTSGKKAGTVVVTYPDRTTTERTVVITVTSEADKYTPEAGTIIIEQGGTLPEAGTIIINKGELPEGTTYEWGIEIDPSKPETQAGTIIVTYPDGSTDTVWVTVDVKGETESDKDKYDPRTDGVIIIDWGKDAPNPGSVIVNIDDLPEGTTYEWETTIDVKTPGTHQHVIVVTYPDGSKDRIIVNVTVKESDADSTTVIIRDITVEQGGSITIEDIIVNPGDIPDGSKIEIIVDTEKTGQQPGKVVITYPDGSTEIIDFTVVVTEKEVVTPDPETPQPIVYDPIIIEGQTPDEHGNIVIILDKDTFGEGTSIVEVVGPGEAVISDKGELIVTPGDNANPGDRITVVVKDPQGNEHSYIVVVEDKPGSTDIDDSVVIIDGKDGQIVVKPGEDANITIIEGESVVINDKSDSIEDFVITDKDGNDITDDFIISDKNPDGDYTITPKDGSKPGEDFTVIIKDKDGKESKVDVEVDPKPFKDTEDTEKGGSSEISKSTGSSEADLKCLAITAGTVGAPLLLLIPLALASQVKIPGLGAFQAQLNGEIARMNDQLQRGLGIANDNVRRMVQQFNGAVAVDNKALGQVGGAIAGVTAVAALLGISAAIYSTCKAANGEFNVSDLSSKEGEDSSSTPAGEKDEA